MSAAHEEHLICHMMGSDEPIRGDKAHRDAMQSMMRSFPDVRVSNDPYPIQFGQGDWTTVVSRVTGTFTGEMERPDGKSIPPTGKAFNLDMTAVARWNGEVIAEGCSGTQRSCNNRSASPDEHCRALGALEFQGMMDL